MTKNRIIVSGAYGVGKSEFCVQYALQNSPCTIADFDILNPYFRPREIKSFLESKYVKVIASHINEGLNQDVPAMSFALNAAVLNNENILIDCAGSVNGLRVLHSLDENFDKAEFWLVLNLNRMESNLKEFDSLIEDYERDSKRKITGFINNTHLLDETSSEMIIESQRKIEAFIKTKNIPVVYTMIHESFVEECIDKINNPILVISHMYLREEWMKGVTL